MVSLNLSKLANISDISLNTTVLQGDIMDNMVNLANQSTYGYYGLIIMIVIFVICYYTFSQNDVKEFKKVIHSLTLSLGVTLIIGLILVATGFVTTFKPIIWFGLVFIISFILSVYEIQKG